MSTDGARVEDLPAVYFIFVSNICPETQTMNQFWKYEKQHEMSGDVQHFPNIFPIFSPHRISVSTPAVYSS